MIVEVPRPECPKDIDFVAPKRERHLVQSFLSEEGWQVVTNLLLVAEDRVTFESKNQDYSIDVFFDTVDGSHPIQLKTRLKTPGPGIRLQDLLLTKLQRQFMRPVDVWDCCVLLKGVGMDTELVFFTQCLSSDWGLFTTVLDNLDMLREKCSPPAQSISILIDAAKRVRKSITWNARAILGRRIKWWREVYSADGGRQV